MPRLALSILFLSLFLASCQASAQPPATPPRPAAANTPRITPTPVLATVAPSAEPSIAFESEAAPTPLPIPTATPFQLVQPDAICGSVLPLRLTPEPGAGDWRDPIIPSDLIPDDVLPALTYFLQHPDDVSLAVYQLGYEGIGFYHNPDRPLPVASVVKLLHLVAYADAIDAGRISPQQPVAEAEVAAYYLPRSDLGAHPRALARLDVDSLTLDDLMSMTMRESANSSADYLHAMLGQERLEQAAIEYNVVPHSAPCPFLGQFLIMSNYAPRFGDNAAIEALASDLPRYGSEVMALTQTYAQDEAFRSAESATWGRNRQPSYATQAEFVQLLSPRGTARAYASLMATIVRGEAGAPTTNALIRNHLEWPLDIFPENAERYRLIGYKNGTLPGVLTTTYYSWPHWSDQPVVLALFFNDLPRPTYQAWRRTLTHDAMAHWLMSNPNAIHIMHVLADHIAPAP